MWIETIFANNVLASRLAFYLNTPSLVKLYNTCTKLRTLFYDPAGWGLSVLQLNSRWREYFVRQSPENWYTGNYLGITPHQAPSRLVSPHRVNAIRNMERSTGKFNKEDMIPHCFAWMNSQDMFCRGGCGHLYSEFITPLSARKYQCCTGCFMQLGTHYQMQWLSLELRFRLIDDEEVLRVVVDLRDRGCIVNDWVAKKEVEITLDRLGKRQKIKE
jgi:hypothetical protein